MKFVGILFIALCIMILSKTSRAATETQHYAYCSGYAAKMATVYRMKYYYNMQKYFDSKVSTDSFNQDELASEYSQSGAEAVNPTVAISQNLNKSCEDAFKGKTI